MRRRWREWFRLPLWALMMGVASCALASYLVAKSARPGGEIRRIAAELLARDGQDWHRIAGVPPPGRRGRGRP